MLRVLDSLVELDLNSLRGRRLDADDFDKLLVSDPVRDLLRWMSNPEAFESSRGNRWESFRNVCRTQFDFDPDKEDVNAAGLALAKGKGAWDTVWLRFCEAPQLYPGIGKLLSEPTTAGQALFSFDGSRNPRANEDQENDVRTKLEAVGNLAPAAAAYAILKLEERHGPRRDWVWATIGQSPWAGVLRPLAKLAQLTKLPLGGATLNAVVSAYTESGWQSDGLALEALAQFKNESDHRVLGRAVRAIYLPWLEASAQHFQDLFRKHATEGRKAVGAMKAEKETCLLFVDGLRYDLGVWLTQKLESRSLLARLSHRLAPLPTVTATAKPAATPITLELKGGRGEDFTPLLAGSKLARATRTLRFPHTRGTGIRMCESFRRPECAASLQARSIPTAESAHRSASFPRS